MESSYRNRWNFALVALLWAAMQPSIVCSVFAQDTTVKDSGGPGLLDERAHRHAKSLREARTTTDGVLPLDELIAVKVRDVTLRVPAAYLSPWPQNDSRNRLNEAKSLRFEFWMPSRRHLEISPLSNASFRPTEPGRGEPDQDDYIVRVWDLQPMPRSEPGYVSPEQAFQNGIRSRQPPGSEFSSDEEDFGLVRYWPKDEPNSDYSVTYRHRASTDPEILLDCIVPNQFRVFPPCSGRVHFAADNLAFFVVFPREKVRRWREIVSAARDLYSSWKVSP